MTSLKKLVFVLTLTLGALPQCETAAADCAPSCSRPPYAALATTQLESVSLDALPGASLSTEEWNFGAGFKRYELDDGRIDLGLDYQYTRYVYQGIPSRNRDLHRLQFPVGFYFDREAYAWRGYVAPSISTSSNVLGDFFNRGSSDDLFVAARIEYAGSGQAASWFGGVAYDRSFGRQRLYPVAGVDITAGDRLSARIAFPDSHLRYAIGDKQAFTARLFPAGHRWHVATDDFSSEFDYSVEAVRARLSWSIEFWRGLTLDVSAGYEVGRRHEFTDDLGNRIESDIDDQWLFGIGVRTQGAGLPYTNGSGLGTPR